MTEEKLPPVEIVVSSVYDVLTGLAMIGNHIKCKEDEVEPLTGDKTLEVIERLRAGLRPRLLSNLDQFFAPDFYSGLGLISVVQEWGALDVPSFLQALYQRPLTEFVRAMLSFGKIYRGNRLFGRTIEELMSDRAVLLEHIERNMSVADDKIAVLADMVMNPAETRDNLAELIEHFWYVIMPPEAERRAQTQEQIAELCRARIQEIGLKRFYEAITDMSLEDQSNGYEAVVLVPTTYYGYGIVGNESPDESKLIIVFGPELKILKTPKPSEGEDPLNLKSLATLYNILGDETRLEIVRALAERPYYGQELAQKFLDEQGRKISNATIFYHLSLLMKTGAVHLERIEHRVYYVLNPEQLQCRLIKAQTLLLGNR